MHEATAIIYMAKFYPLQSAHIEHSRFQKRRKGTSLQLSFHLSDRSFGKIPSKVGQQSISAFIELNSHSPPMENEEKLLGKSFFLGERASGLGLLLDRKSVV